MYICKKCGRKKKTLTPQSKTCKKCGGKSFTTPEMEKAGKVLEKNIKGQ